MGSSADVRSTARLTPDRPHRYRFLVSVAAFALCTGLPLVAGVWLGRSVASAAPRQASAAPQPFFAAPGQPSAAQQPVLAAPQPGNAAPQPFLAAPLQAGAAPPIAAVAELRRMSDDSGDVVDATAYELLSAHTIFAWPEGYGDAGLATGIGVIALPHLVSRMEVAEPSTILSVANAVARPGFTDFAIFLYDQNGLFDYVCVKLNESQIEYLDLRRWGFLNPGFQGSAVISAVFWEHDVFDDQGRFARTQLGLGATVFEYAEERPVNMGDTAVARVGVPVYVHAAMDPRGFQPGVSGVCNAGPGGRPRPSTHTPTPGTGTPTPTPTPTLTPTPTHTHTPTVTPTPLVPPPYPPAAPEVHLPALSDRGTGGPCDAGIVVQNLGPESSKATLVVWGAPSACAEGCTGPLAVVCSGLLNTGTAWHFATTELPAGARSGTLFSFSNRPAHEIMVSERGVSVADLMCALLGAAAVGDCEQYRLFKQAYDRGLEYHDVPMNEARGSAMAAEVRRDCADTGGTSIAGRNATGTYNGASGPALGYGEPGQPTFEYVVPVLHAGDDGQRSVIHVQNAGDACAAVKVDAQGRTGGGAPRRCLDVAVAPGEAVSVDAGRCLDEGAAGSARVRADGPLAVVVDTSGPATLTSYTAPARDVRTMFGDALFDEPNAFAVAPLLFKNYQGWTSRLNVQNASDAVSATLKVSLLDRHGDPVSVREFGPLSPGTSLDVDLETVGGIPYSWTGSARIESAPAGGPPLAPAWLWPEPTSTPSGTPPAPPTAGPSPTGGPTATPRPTGPVTPTPTPVRPPTETPVIPPTPTRTVTDTPGAPFSWTVCLPWAERSRAR